ncbi:NAD(P)/FAD-dependent oxidoreductase [Oryzihumus sp.]|uniref:NAD(P)/FAD-dependent oxidoreductase n=1 Tax=Oryzihumus sp. TaxID=1968903 RepID=UPI002ED81C8A
MRRHVVVIGAGAAGTMVAHRLRRRLDPAGWAVTVIDRDDQHAYRPGFPLVALGTWPPSAVVRSRHAFLPDGVDLVLAEARQVDADASVVLLADGRRIAYDHLVIATGAAPRPDLVPGMTGPHWHRSVFDVHSLDGATALRDALPALRQGRLLVHLAELPVPAPFTALELTLLADAWLRRRGLRDGVELVHASPLPEPSAGAGGLLGRHGVAVEAGFRVERIDGDHQALVGQDGRELSFDLLVTVPPHRGAGLVTRSGLGDELGYLPVDRHTLQSTAFPTVYGVGDATDLPTQRTTRAAWLTARVVGRTLPDHATGRAPSASLDRRSRGLPLGPSDDGLTAALDRLTGTRSRAAARWLYWHVALQGRPLPLPVHAAAVPTGLRRHAPA